MKQFTPIQIANRFLKEYGEQSSGISHMKLQKLVYCVHGWWLTQKEQNSILSENPELWKFGPVFSSLYHELKIYGTEQITAPVKPSPFDSDAPMVDDDNIKKLIDWVWQRYGHLSAMALSDITHRDGSAWKNTAKEHHFRVPDGLEIKVEAVRNEFTSVQQEFASGR